MVVASPPPRIPLAPDQALTAASTTSCWPIVGAHQLPQFDRSNGCYSLILPDGQITDLLSSPSAKNISLLRRPKSTLQIPPSRPERGALRGRHGRWVRDAVDAAASGAGGGHHTTQRAAADARCDRRATQSARTNDADADGEVVWS